VKYLKFFDLTIIAFLGFLLFWQIQFLYRYIVLDNDVAMRAEISLTMLMFGIVAVVAIVIAIPSLIYRPKKSRIGTILIVMCSIHFLLLLFVAGS